MGNLLGKRGQRENKKLSPVRSGWSDKKLEERTCMNHGNGDGNGDPENPHFATHVCAGVRTRYASDSFGNERVECVRLVCEACDPVCDKHPDRRKICWACSKIKKRGTKKRNRYSDEVWARNCDACDRAVKNEPAPEQRRRMMLQARTQLKRSEETRAVRNPDGEMFRLPRHVVESSDTA